MLARYQQALERLDVSGTGDLFTPDSEIIESGSVEGSYAAYLAHHLAPELAEFKSFNFTDYRVAARLEGLVALANQGYRFRIVPKSGVPAERIGAATSVLRKFGDRWKIVRMHNSAHRPPAP